MMAEHRRPKDAMWSPIPIAPISPCIYFRMVIFISDKWLAGAYVRRRTRRRTTCRQYWSTYAWHTFMQFDIGDPFYGQLSAVKARYSLTSTI